MTRYRAGESMNDEHTLANNDKYQVIESPYCRHVQSSCYSNGVDGIREDTEEQLVNQTSHIYENALKTCWLL